MLAQTKEHQGMLETTRSYERSKERFPRAIGGIAHCFMIQHGHHTSTFPELPFNTFTYILLARIT